MKNPPRILLAGPEWHGELLPSCERALQQLGCEVRSVVTSQSPALAAVTRTTKRMRGFPVIGPSLAWRYEQKERARHAEQANQRFVAAVRETRPDIVLLVLCWGEALRPDIVAGLSGVVRVGWYMDDPFWWGGIAPMLDVLDRVYAIDRSWVDVMRLTTKAPTSLLASGADPILQRPVPAAEIPAGLRSDLVFVGSSYQGEPPGQVRRHLVAAVADLDLRIYGDSGWRDLGVDGVAARYGGRKLSASEVNAAYCGSKIVLTIHHPQFRQGTSLRTFAAAAIGAFQLADGRPGLDEYFEPDKELVTFRSAEDLREKTLRYLREETARNAIARAAHERTLREHTYAHRLKQMLRDIGSD